MTHSTLAYQVRVGDRINTYANHYATVTHKGPSPTGSGIRFTCEPYANGTPCWVDVMGDVTVKIETA